VCFPLVVLVMYGVVIAVIVITFHENKTKWRTVLANLRTDVKSTKEYKWWLHRIDKVPHNVDLHWDRGFESHLGMDVCVCSVCVFSVSP
jgi:hypothetical protein